MADYPEIPINATAEQLEAVAVMGTAPEDGKTYGRKDGDWVEVEGGSVAPLIIEREGTNITVGIITIYVPKLTNADLVDIIDAFDDGKTVYLKVENSDISYLVSYAESNQGYVLTLGFELAISYWRTGYGDTYASISAKFIENTTVDQDYTPSSENPQSGRAVAEAIASVPSAVVDQTYDGTSTNAQSGTAVAEAVAYIVKTGSTTVSDKTVPNPSASDLGDIAYYIGKRRVIVKDLSRNLYYNVLTAETKSNGYRVILAARDGSAFIDYQYTNGGSVEIAVRQARVTVDQVYDSTSTNAQSGTAVAGALANIPTVTVDQTFDGTSANAQSGVAVQGKLSTMPNYQTKTTVDNVLVRNTKYVLGEQSALSLTMPTTPLSFGNTIEVIFSSGATACNLTCDLTGFDFVPQANKTNKIVFEYIATDTWSVSVKESA